MKQVVDQILEQTKSVARPSSCQTSVSDGPAAQSDSPTCGQTSVSDGTAAQSDSPGEREERASKIILTGIKVNMDSTGGKLVLLLVRGWKLETQ